MRVPLGRLPLTVLTVSMLMLAVAHAQVAPPTAVLFENVRIFDGQSSALSAPSNVLVKGNKIERISTAPIPTDRRADTRIIQGNGRTLMPGLIDVHWHAAMAAVPLQTLMIADIGYINLVAGKTANGLKRAIDEGVIDGPRIWPSGAMVSQSGGHGDFRMPYEVPAAPNLADLLLVDGDPIANIQLIADPEKNFTVIMKDGMIYKNALK